MGIVVVLVGIGGIGALLCMKHSSLSAKMIRNLKGMRMAAFIKKGIGAGGTYRYYNTKKCFCMACHAQAPLAVKLFRILHRAAVRERIHNQIRLQVQKIRGTDRFSMD